MARSKKGIPTEYNGIRFRSRLEATWAAFFDLLRWKWTYEPFDLEGYIPDFIVQTVDGGIVFEVKPAVSSRDFDEPIWRIQKTSWLGGYVVVGVDLMRVSDFVDTQYGISAESLKESSADTAAATGLVADDLYAVAVAGVLIGVGSLLSKDAYILNTAAGMRAGRPAISRHVYSTPQTIDLDTCFGCNRSFPSDDFWRCLLCGFDNRSESGGRRGPQPEPGLTLSLWATAKNRVQWKGGFGA